MHLSQRIEILAASLLHNLKYQAWQLLMAESCTGGQLAAAMTQCAGSSDGFSHSLVTYSNTAKMKFLKVPSLILEQEGAVSEACVQAMVTGLNPNQKQIAVATTGYAGPGGGDEHYPVGTVFLAWSTPGLGIECEQVKLSGKRLEIIQQAVFLALRGLILRSLYPVVYAKLHYFFALVCDEALQTSCQALGVDVGIDLVYMEPKSNLHLTLGYLGQLSEEARQTWVKKAEKLAQSHGDFDLNLLGLNYWQKPDAYVIEAELTPELLALATELGAESHFRPHISLSKRNRISLAIQGKNLNETWHVSRFALCISWHGACYFEYAGWELLKSTGQGE